MPARWRDRESGPSREVARSPGRARRIRGAGGLPGVVSLHPDQRPAHAQPAGSVVAGEREHQQRPAPEPPGVGGSCSSC